jgi:hypothetical protein
MRRIPPPLEVVSLVGSAAEDYRWRGVERRFGSIQGVKSNLVLMATDGNLGVFADSNGKLMLGHIQNFSGNNGRRK